jgi:hypothetical protein
LVVGKHRGDKTTEAIVKGLAAQHRCKGKGFCWKAAGQVKDTLEVIDVS